MYMLMVADRYPKYHTGADQKKNNKAVDELVIFTIFSLKLKIEATFPQR